MTVILGPDARARLDKHLDAVEQALVAAGNSREQRRAVLDDLEAQILDMLAARSQTPTIEDVQAVLAQLDPPSAYGNTASAATVPPMIPPPAPILRPRYSRTAIWGLACILFSLLSVILLAISYFSFSTRHVRTSSPPISMEPERLRLTPRTPEIGPTPQLTTMEATSLPGISSAQKKRLPVTQVTLSPCLILFFGPFGLLGTILGWIAFFQLHASKGALRGKGLALFDGLFYPIATPLLIVLVILLSVA